MKFHTDINFWLLIVQVAMMIIMLATLKTYRRQLFAMEKQLKAMRDSNTSQQILRDWFFTWEAHRDPVRADVFKLTEEQDPIQRLGCCGCPRAQSGRKSFARVLTWLVSLRSRTIQFYAGLSLNPCPTPRQNASTSLANCSTTAGRLEEKTTGRDLTGSLQRSRIATSKAVVPGSRVAPSIARAALVRVYPKASRIGQLTLDDAAINVESPDCHVRARRSRGLVRSAFIGIRMVRWIISLKLG